jgi:hypothetical protein
MFTHVIAPFYPKRFFLGFSADVACTRRSNYIARNIECNVEDTMQHGSELTTRKIAVGTNAIAGYEKNALNRIGSR